MHWLIWLFRLPAVVYFIAAPLVLAGGGYTVYAAINEETAKDLARRAPPPAAVAIESFNEARNVGKADEVELIGQLDLERSMEMTQTKRGVEEHHWTAIPIYPAKAADTSGAAPGVLIQDGPLTDAQLARMQVGVGAFGPILKIDGRRTTDTDAQTAVEKVFAAKGPEIQSAVLVDPFENGRGEGLKPSEGKRSTGIGVMVLALLVAGYGVFRRWQRQQLVASGEGYI